MFRIITIPFDRGQNGFDDTILNKFLLNKKLKSYQAEFFDDHGEKFWTLLLEYDPVLEKGLQAFREYRGGMPVLFSFGARAPLVPTLLRGNVYRDFIPR